MSLWPLLTCSPTSTVRLLTTPDNRRNDLAVAEVELRLVDLSLHRLNVSLFRLQIGLGYGYLIGSVYVRQAIRLRA